MPKNAITIIGDIERCWLFAYRIPAQQLTDQAPKPLQLVTKGGFGFVNVVISELAHIRPLGLPAFVGMRYWHIAYRIYVRFCPQAADPIEGLYFLRSDADSRMMVAGGNLLTDFRFHVCRVENRQSGTERTLKVDSSDAPAIVRLCYAMEPQVALGSPFADLNEAQAFLKYKPAGISVNRRGVDVLRITRDEAAWRSKLIHVVDADFAFLKPFDATLEACYEVEPVHYRWNRAERYY